MKCFVIFALALAAVCAAPVEESTKTKRGIFGGVSVGHSYVTAHAPVYHAPLALHAPLVAHAPLLSAPLVTKTVVPHYRLTVPTHFTYSHAPLALGHSFW